MTPQEALEKLLPSFKRYYNIKTEDVTPPFAAEAEFFTHDVAYMLLKSAKLAESESRELIYFSAIDHLHADTVASLDATAWETGMSKVQINEFHHSTDVSLIILADTIDKDAVKLIKKLRHHKSYCFNFKGFSRYRLIALETSTGKIAHNHLGGELKKLISNIQK